MPKPKRRAPQLDRDALRRVRISFIRRGTLFLGGQPESAMLMDLALNGVFVERLEPLALDTLVEIEFFLPGNEIPVRSRCRVAWCHDPGQPLISKSLPYGLGLEFVEPRESDLSRIAGLLEEQIETAPRGRQFARRWSA